ncbi:helix-turn-helix domain-containing protein [Gorillibacterium sp. sgz5001074]|uniref:helix-turn-helix domain-containing protein n=1 Tax=Gorillibacterium sp. sgz5001074 TaxID=3446695 RepID=UPI003F676B63
MAVPRASILSRLKSKFLFNDHPKFALFCFAIAAVPVLILGSFSYFKSSGIVLESVSREKVLNVKQLQSSIEQLLVTVERSSTHFLRSNTLKAGYYEPLSPFQFDLYNMMKEELNHLQTLDSGITDITLFSKEGNWIINNTGMNRLSDWAGAAPFIQLAENARTSEWRVVPAPSGGTGTGAASGSSTAVNPNGCESTVHYIRKLPVSAYEQTGLYDVTIPSCNLEKLFALDRQSEFVAVLDEKQQIIASEGNLTAGQMSGIREAVTREIERSPSGQLQWSLDRTDYSITYSRSEYNNWVYLSVVTLGELTRPSREIGWFTIYICLILLALFLFISWSGSKRLFLPILNLYQLVAKETNDKPGQQRVGELRYIGEQLSRLIYTKSELESKLHGHVEQSRILFMVRLFQGHLKEAEILRHLEAFGLPQLPAGGPFAVLALQIKSLDHTRYEEKDRDLLMFAVNNIVGELIPPHKRLYPILIGQAQVTLIFADSEETETFTNEMNGIARQIVAAANDYLNLPVRIGVSNPFREWSLAPRAFEEGMEALHYGIRDQDEEVHYFSDLGEDHGLHVAFPQELETRLFEAIKQGDRETVSRQLDAIVGSAFDGWSQGHGQAAGQNQNQGAVQPFVLIRLLIDLLGLMQSFGIKSEQTGDLEQSWFDQLFRLKSPEEARFWFDSTMVQPLVAHIRDRTESRHQQLAQHMVQMIEEQFETDLSIDSCAEQLHYNANYLNTLFRKEMNMPFGAYLAQYRHQMAKHWLTETELSVKEISERLRYNNSQNFIRSFRKTEGITPGEYKKQNGKPTPD